ncbi:hypothetical protein ACFO4O_04525 [Glaciecola siphonariae]|uniref:Uncharacterized protein n=1 Tax=Glaciecola siphonariae TaxID=521012 RepID=A0ABV9LU97_9ALTE
MKNDAHIQQMLAKQYDFDVKNVLVRARDLSAQNNWVLVQGILTIISVAIVLGFIFVIAFGIETIEQAGNLDNTQNAIASLVINVILAPLIGGVTMLAITSVRRLEAKAVNMFAYFGYILPLGVATLLISIASDIGLMLMVLPGLYIAVATVFATPLIIDKHLTPISAIILSMRMCNAYLFQMTVMFLIFVALMVGVFITFGFALIWVGPYYLNVKAILYHDLFCGEQPEESLENQNTGVFDA